MWSHLSEVSLYEMRACFRCARWSPRSYPTFIVCISHISKGDEPVCLWSVETKPYSEVDLFPRALPQAPSRPYQATYLDLGSSQLALGFWLLFSFDLLNFSFATLQSMRPSLFCLPCLANPPTRANVLSMPSSSQEPNKLWLQLIPSTWRPAAPLSFSQRCWLMLYLQCDRFAPAQNRKENLG